MRRRDFMTLLGAAALPMSAQAKTADLIDHAFTRPWTVLKGYRRDPAPHPVWQEYFCSGDQELIKIGKETYYRGGDDNLMPTRSDQPPPDLRYFKGDFYKPMRN